MSIVMGTNTETNVVGGGTVIVPPKRPRSDLEQVKFRWPPDLAEDIRKIAERTGRSINEAGEMMMRWAVERTKAELDAEAEQPPSPKKKRQE